MIGIKLVCDECDATEVLAGYVKAVGDGIYIALAPLPARWREVGKKLLCDKCRGGTDASK